MSAEAPVQIDLSQEDSWDQIDDSMLNQQEKEMLARQFAEESEGIISLTHEELKEFRQIISSELPKIVASELQNFVTEQKNEGLSTRDFDDLSTSYLLGENFEQFEGIDELSGQVLFEGPESIFGGLNISPEAQDSMGVALSLATIEHVSSQDVSQGTDIMSEMLKVMGEQLGELKSLADSELILGQTSTVPQLDIRGMGENNSIFMNPAEGKNFFIKILRGEIDIQAMENMLEDANQDTPIEGVDISSIPSKIQEHAGNLLEKIEALQNGNTDTGNIDSDDIETALDEAEESGSESIGIMRFLENLFKMFGLEQLFEGVLSDNEDKTDDGDDPEETETTPEETEANQKLIDMIDKVSPFNEESVEYLKNNPATATRIRKIIEGISAEQTFEQTFKEVFDSGDILASNGFKAGTIFEEYGFEASLPEGLSQFEKGIRMLEEYSRYRNSDGVRSLTSGRTTWQAWAEKRQNENWSVSGR